MAEHPGIDPFDVLGVDEDADAIVIQLAYKARIRAVHPDIAGPAGLEQTKRLNAARDWLLDPELRAQLVRPAATRRPSDDTGPAGTRRKWQGRTQRGRDAAGPHDLSGIDAFAFDFGPRTGELRVFFRTVLGLTRDERARVNHSLGEERPVDFEAYWDYLGPQLWSRSRALRAAVSKIWSAGIDDEAPSMARLGRIHPSGFLVANAYAQWILLGDFLRRELGDVAFRSEHVLESFAERCAGPWLASVGQARYGPHAARVNACFASARMLTSDAADRLARTWLRTMASDAHGAGSDRIGPGVWLPAPSNVSEVIRVSGYLAAVDATRIEPPAGLDRDRHDAFRYGLRLTAHVLATGLADEGGRDYLAPWRAATEPDRPRWRRNSRQRTDDDRRDPGRLMQAPNVPGRTQSDW